MKSLVVCLAVAGLVLSLGVPSFAASKSSHPYKVGDAVHVCGCGEGCDCYTISRNPGKCTCDKDLVPAKVTKISSGTVTVKGEDWEKARVFKTAGGCRCTCGKGCKCDTISQKPGKCSCGTPLKKS